MPDLEAVDRDLAALASEVPDVRALVERYGESDLRLSNVDAVLATLGDAGAIELAQDEAVSTDTLVDRPSFLPLGWVPESEASADAEADAEAELQAEAERAAPLAASTAPEVAVEIAEPMPEPADAAEAPPVASASQEPSFAASTPDVTVVSAAPLESDALDDGEEPAVSFEAAEQDASPTEATVATLSDAPVIVDSEPPDAWPEPARASEAPAVVQNVAADALDAAVDEVLAGSQRAVSHAPESQAPAAPASQRPARNAELNALLDEVLDPSDFDAPRRSAPVSAPPPLRSSFPPRPRSSSAPPRSSAPPPLPPVPRPSLPVPAAQIPDVDELELLVDDEDIIEISEDA